MSLGVGAGVVVVGSVGTGSGGGLDILANLEGLRWWWMKRAEGPVGWGFMCKVERFWNQREIGEKGVDEAAQCL